MNLPDLPPALTRFVSRYAIPIAIVAAVLLLGTAVAITALMSPAGLALPASTRVSQTEEIPDTLRAGGLLEEDQDRDGLGDALENYLYGTDPTSWNSSGLGVPDGWLVAAGLDPLSPATATATGALTPAEDLPPAYGGVWPPEFRLPLSAYYAVGKPAGYRPGVDAPWWEGRSFASPSQAVAASGLPTAWLVRYGLDPNDATLAGAVAPGSSSPLTVKEAFEFNTNPMSDDSDGDGLTDLAEIRTHKTDPSRFSTSGSGIADGWAIQYGLDPRSRDVAGEDADKDGLTNLEEFVTSASDFRADVATGGIKVLFDRGLDPLDATTSGSDIPDGWLVTYGLDPYDAAEADRVLQRASDYAGVRFLADAPAGETPIPDLVLTVRGAYEHGRPTAWKEAIDGVWWGGTIPSETDSDEDGLPDAVEMRGWYVNVTFGLGPQAASEWIVAESNPRDDDSDADLLRDAEEYNGRAACTSDDVRTFKPTDPRNKDTAFSGLTDREKVCGVVRGAFTYDFGKAGQAGLDPSRADTAGDYLRDGAKVEYWHERYARYLSNARYEFANSSYGTVTEWAKKYPRFAALPDDEILKQFRPDGDVDADGLTNVLDPDPSGGLVDPKNARVVLLPQGLQIDPTLYRFSEHRSTFPRPATDPANPDTDGDGLPTWWEVKYGTYSAEAGGWTLDPSKFSSLGDGVPDWKRNDDQDTVPWYGYRKDATGARVRVANGLESQPYDYNNLEEFTYGTNPSLASTVGDGIPDGWKVFWGLLYPTLAAQGGAGDLTEAELELIRGGSGRISPLADLKGEGNEAKTQGYARFVNLTTCEGLTEQSLRDAKLIYGEETLRMESATGPVRCDVTTLGGRAQLSLARVVGTFTLTYKLESAYGTNPYLLDTDGDGAADAYEACMMLPSGGGSSERADRGCAGQALPLAGPTFPNPTAPETGVDRDGDGLDPGRECKFDLAAGQCLLLGNADHPGGSNPNLADTDIDGVDDGLEVGAGLDPMNPSDVAKFESVADTDGDKILDYVELTGWGKAYYTVDVKTDPGRADSEDRGCATSPAGAEAWYGDNLLDGDAVVLDPATHAELIALWKARGVAWIESGDRAKFLGEVPLTSPRLGDTSCDRIPDGWQAYYFTRGISGRAPNEPDTEGLPRYERSKPSWWSEAGHGTWWWGVAPGASADDVDLDNDGLDDVAGEDPFNATSTNRYAFGAFTTTNPEVAAAFIRDAPAGEESRQRAQAYGEGAGNPVKARADAASVARFPAGTRIVDVAFGNGTRVVGDRVEIQKGREFVVTGRLVIDEGSSPDTGKGVPNATVLVSALARDPRAVLGAAFTGPDGRFTIKANATPAHAVTGPPGAVLFNRNSGAHAWTIDADALAVGTQTAGVDNTLVVWSYRSPPSPPVGSPYSGYAFRKASGTTAVDVDRAEAAPVKIAVVSGTTVDFEIAPALNGGTLKGTLSLTDASGAGLGDQNVTIRWSGAGGAVVVIGEGNAKVRTDAKGAVNVTALRIPVGVADPGSYTLEVVYAPTSPDLRGSRTRATVPVRNPVELTAATASPSLAAGDEFFVDGLLRTLPYAVPGAGTIPGAPATGEVVRIEFAGVSATATTDTNGRYSARIAVPADASPGANVVKVTYAGSDRLAPASEARVPVVVKRGTEILDVRETSAARGGGVQFSGRLVDSRGEGLADRPVDVVLGGRAATRAVTVAGGAFIARMDVPVSAPLGLADVVFRFAGDEEFAASENVTRVKVFSETRFDGVQATKPVVRGKPVVVRARLVDGQGAPVAAAPVDFYWRGQETQRAVTAADGTVAFTLDLPANERLGPVEIGLLHEPPATSIYRSATAALTSKVLAGVSLELPAKDLRRGLVAIQGRLLDDRGNAVPGQLVNVTWGGVEVGAARTARNGTFSVPYEIPRLLAAGPQRVTATFAPPPDSRYAGAANSTTYALHGTPAVALTEAGAVVRGEPFVIKGTLLEDNGRPAPGTLVVTLGGERLGEAKVAPNGRFELRTRIADGTPRGEATLSVAFAGTRYLDPARLDLPVVVKIRPEVELEVPRVILEGLAYSGEVTLRDDLGAPLRNQTFVYVVSGSPQPQTAVTDAEGKAVVGGVARSGGSFVSLTVKGTDDIVPTQFKSASVRVVGPTASPAYGLLVLLVIVLLAIVVALLLYARHRRRQIREVRQILDETIDALLAGNEYVGTIFLAYKRLSAHLAQHGYVEKKEDTAREFASGVRRALPIEPESLRVLVRLFEEARYSDHEVGREARDKAVAALTGVRGELSRILGDKPREAGA